MHRFATYCDEFCATVARGPWQQTLASDPALASHGIVAKSVEREKWYCADCGCEVSASIAANVPICHCGSSDFGSSPPSGRCRHRMGVINGRCPGCGDKVRRR